RTEERGQRPRERDVHAEARRSWIGEHGIGDETVPRDLLLRARMLDGREVRLRVHRDHFGLGSSFEIASPADIADGLAMTSVEASWGRLLSAAWSCSSSPSSSWAWP